MVAPSGLSQIGQANRPVRWQGCSGRVYSGRSEHLDSFAMDPASLYLLAKGRNALWVGSSDELVADPMSRARFRLAMSCADKVFRLSPADQQGERLSTIYDLENGEPAFAISAQAA